MENSKPRLLVIDGMSFIYRAFHGYPVERFSSPNGEPTNAIHGFFSMLNTLFENSKAEGICVALDAPGGSFRTEMVDDYKGGRAQTPDGFREQVSAIEKLLKAVGISTLKLEGYEADDIIAAVAKKAAAEGWLVNVCSSDKDLVQLVDNDIHLVRPLKGVTEIEYLTPPKVVDKFGVHASRYRELAALVGEKSDNLPGVPGVGPKTAAKWINSYPTLKALLDDAANMSSAVGKKLSENREIAERNYEVNRLRDEVPISFVVETMRLPLKGDEAAFNALCDHYAINSVKRNFSRRLFRAPEPVVSEDTLF